MSNDLRRGLFVNTPLGLGRVLANPDPHAAEVAVRFFVGPSQDPYVDQVMDRAGVKPSALAEHTRVYTNDGARWRIGRTEGPHPDREDHWLVAFPNSEGAVLPAHALDVRWSQPVGDPFSYLASVGGDSPLIYQNRLDYLASWARQRRLASGAEGLLLGSVELHSHQLEVVRRVSQDPIKRYLLADEVGLGKTVEAVALIWQFLRRVPQGRVLVLTPRHLRRQWADEMVNAFRLDAFPHADVSIEVHDDQSGWPRDSVDLVVVDEAHHLTSTASYASGPAWERLRGLAHEAKELLLLSATPVRSNEAGFLDLLHLLDPAHYDRDDLEGFTRRVALRDQLALICQSLVDDVDEFDLTLYSDELRALFPDDGYLTDILDEALGADEGARPSAVARLREYLSSSYRLHHRLLRTRREGEVAKQFSVRGRRRASPFLLSLPDGSDQQRERVLESLQSLLLTAIEGSVIDQATACQVFAAVAERCGALIPAVASLLTVEGRLNEAGIPRLAGCVPDDEREEFERALRNIVAAEADAALQQLVPNIARLAGADGSRRIVLVSQFTEVARAVAAELVKTLPARRVALHVQTQDTKANNLALVRWRDKSDCSVLVCDAGAEEGLNLQEADLMLHLDLPWQAARLEQRIGRCDRHARSGQGPVPSMVVLYGSQTYAQAWLELLSDSVGVFQRSVSSLQYVLADEEVNLISAVLRNGYEALWDAADIYEQSLQSERNKIAAHDALDSVQEVRKEAQDINKLLVASDESRTLPHALTTWLDGVGGRGRTVKPGVVRYARGRLQVPIDLQLALNHGLNTDLALTRAAAVQERLPIVRAGLSFVDALAEHLLRSDRGVCFALYRPKTGEWPPRVALRTDYLVSAALDIEVLEAAEAATVSEWLRRQADECFPPSVVTVDMDALGQAIGPEDNRGLYEQRTGDRNLASRPDLFRRLASQLDWNELCASAPSLARNLLDGHSVVTEVPRRAADELHHRIFAANEARRARRRSGGSADSTGDLGRLLEVLPDRLGVSIEVLGCGATLIADPELSHPA